MKPYTKPYTDETIAWPDPTDLLADTSVTADPVFTQEMAALPDYAFDRAELLGVEPGTLAMAMLPVLSSALHDRIRIQHDLVNTTWTERAHANTMIVNPPGTAKTPTMNDATAPLEKIEAEWRKTFERDYANWKDYEEFRKKSKTQTASEMPEKPKPIWRRLRVGNMTTEGVAEVCNDNPGGLLNVQDEFAGFIGSFDAYRRGGVSIDQSFWNKTDDGGVYLRDRVGKHERVENVGMCHVGFIQPEPLRKIVKDLPADGFVQRPFIVTPSLVEREKVVREPNAAAAEEYERVLRRILTYDPLCHQKAILFDWEALQFQSEVEGVAQAFRRLPTTPAPLRAHLLKWPGRFLRLALTFHAVECARRGDKVLAPYVSAEAGKRVRDLMLRYLLPHAVRFYGEFFRTSNQVDHDIRWIAQHIVAHKLPEISARDIGRASDGQITGATEPMEVLLYADWVGKPIVSGSGQRQSTIWPVNPKVHGLDPKRAEAERVRREAARAQLIEAKQRAAKLKADAEGVL